MKKIAFSVSLKDYEPEKLNEIIQPFDAENKGQVSDKMQTKQRLGILHQQKDVKENEIQLQKKGISRFEILFARELFPLRKWA